jgi:hypothetical protein
MRGTASGKSFSSVGLISQDQHDSLAKGAQEWVRLEQQDQVPGDGQHGWVTNHLVERKYQPEDFGFEVEEVDLSSNNSRSWRRRLRVRPTKTLTPGGDLTLRCRNHSLAELVEA